MSAKSRSNGSPMSPVGWQDQPVSQPSQPSPDQLRDLLHSMDPSLRLIASRPLAGGVSAQLTAIDARDRELAPVIDMTALRQWDLYTALRHADRMRQWGLAPGDQKRLEAGHQEFIAAALAAP
jgi:hypothetical protein